MPVTASGRASRSGGYPPPHLAWAMWASAALFYLAGVYQRVSPAAKTTELMRDFSIDAGQLGTLSAIYFYAYVVMQLPTGLLLDWYGARRLLLGGILVASVGVGLFGVADSFVIAVLGRGLVGAASAVAWVVMLKLATQWFPPGRFGMLAGLGLSVGNLGALIAQIPLRLLIERYGWRVVTVASAAGVVAVGVAAWWLVVDDPADVGFASYAEPQLDAAAPSRALAHLGAVVTRRNTWLITLAQGGLAGGVLSFTGLWGPPFITTRYAVDLTTAIAVCSIMATCWAVASPVAGYVSDRMGSRRTPYLAGAAIAAAGWCSIAYAPIPFAAFVIAVAVTGAAAGTVILGFPYAKESVPLTHLGAASGMVNSGTMLGPMLLQPAIGLALETGWSGVTVDGVHAYDAVSFTRAFGLIVGWAVVSVMAIACTSETHCRQAT